MIEISQKLLRIVFDFYECLFVCLFVCLCYQKPTSISTPPQHAGHMPGSSMHHHQHARSSSGNYSSKSQRERGQGQGQGRKILNSTANSNSRRSVLTSSSSPGRQMQPMVGSDFSPISHTSHQTDDQPFNSDRFGYENGRDQKKNKILAKI